MARKHVFKFFFFQVEINKKKIFKKQTRKNSQKNTKISVWIAKMHQKFIF